MKITQFEPFILHVPVTGSQIADSSQQVTHWGAVGVIVINHGDRPVTIAHGDRIAQAVIAPVTRASFVEAQTLDDTERGAGGFGSTGRT